MKLDRCMQVMSGSLLGLITFALFAVPVACADEKKKDPSLPTAWSEKIDWRSIGPANMMGRVTSIAVYEQDSNIWWAASASGGLIKTTNNGVTFVHQFDDQGTVSIGDVQVSKTDPDVVWVGTGESNPRNSVSWGDGVYKSLDGGKTWKNMGLKKIFQTGRIAIHPDDHNVVYVGALGRLWGPNKERGLFKTTDGGETWDKILFVDDKTGVVDVQMNPENPDELLVATYERMRDGFDGNDPVKKYGAGSGIYKTVDGGKSFTRMTNGLPSCNLGRIGLNYFHKDPNYVTAIVESEKIAKEPKDVPYAGLRGENADVGAKITSVVDDGPSEKAGLKADDIVISINGDIVHSYNELLAAIRKQKPGETVKLVVSRDRKPVDIVLELGERPERRRRNNNNNRRGNRRTPFTGTLGGQAANLQGQQGENEHEYGGIYLSKDGGDTWERINTLNPRPMYYSQIRFDPVDRNNMYVLGTSLYRSKDGGETFTPDGGRGVHVDHHALWIDPDDPRHMILGNDGGIYVTHDRMDNWDHHNHAALGQFYHVGVGPRVDYRVYGGLQDNGSWGGPVRASNDSGTINSDWFRVGGGDGFVTLVDPTDADEIYFESQNGAMGRVNLRTGDRGFIRPRPPRGTRYRFNWKTPFILSPHNSRIHYSAGNHVFRSFNKGAGVEAISKDITNTSKGAGSAITESGAKAGVLYVGTTDGALWMTKNGGQSWEACYSKPEKKKAKGDQDESKDKEGAQDNKEGDSGGESGAKDKASGDSSEKMQKESKSTEASKQTKEDTSGASVNGIWNGWMISDRFPEGQEPTITFEFKVDEAGKLTGEIETRRGSQEITSGEFDANTGELNFVIETERGKREFTAKVADKLLTGEMSAGRRTIEFKAEKQEDPSDDDKALHFLSMLNVNAAINGVVVATQSDDPVSGKWEGIVRSDQLPGGELKFSIELDLDKDNVITGSVYSPRGEFDIAEGAFETDSKKLYFSCENENALLDFEGVLDGDTLTGDVMVNDALTLDFDASRVKSSGSANESKQEQSQTDESKRAVQPANNQDDEAPAERPVLGVIIADGMTVRIVVDNSAAEKAGIEVGDVIQAINDQEVSELDDLREQLSEFKVGDEVEVRYERDGTEKTVTATLGAAAPVQRGRLPAGNRFRPPTTPQGQPAEPGRAEGSRNNQDDSSDQRPFLGVSLADGLTVTNVVDNSASDKAGLEVGDVIRAINDQEVAEADELRQQLLEFKVGDEIEVRIERDGTEQTVRAKLGGAPLTARQRRLPARNRPGRPPVDRPSSDESRSEQESQQSTESETANTDSSLSPAEQDNSSEATTSDTISGTWEGTIDSPQGESELTLVLKQDAKGKVTGTYETTRSEGDITEGEFKAEDQSLVLVAENERFSLEFIGKVSGDAYDGELEFNGGTFTLEFAAKRTKPASSDSGSDQTNAVTKTASKPMPLDQLMPGPRWVSSLHASKYKAERCYATFDGHRSNDDMPYLFVSEDYGKTWSSIQSNLPNSIGSVRVLREDIKNENVLYLGCEFGAWVSIDRGSSWTKFANMPTVAVHEFAQHETLDDVVAATHGRSLWVADVSALRQLGPDATTVGTKLFKPRDVINWRTTARRGSSGTRKFVANNAPVEARIFYSLSDNARSVDVEIRNLKGEVINRFEEPSRSKGLHSLTWNLRSGGNQPAGGRGRGRFGRRISNGTYLVNMYVNGELFQSTLTVKNDPNSTDVQIAEDEELFWWLEFCGEIDN